MRNDRSYFRTWYASLSSPTYSARKSITCVFYNTAIVTTLNSRSWEVHTEIELDTTSPSLQSISSTSSDPTKQEEAVLEYVRNVPEGNASKRALLLKVSHVGGHKLAGNMVLYTPSGAGIWYGRVTPKEVRRLPLLLVMGGSRNSCPQLGSSNRA